MHKKDMQIVCCLRQDSRQKLVKICKKTNIPVSTIYERLKNLEKGIIKRYTSLIDFSELGFNARANIILKVERSQREALKDCLMKKQNVNCLVKINNGFDFFIEVIFKEIREIEAFMEELEDKFKIKSMQVNYIIEDIKKESFLSDLDLVDLVKTD